MASAGLLDAHTLAVHARSRRRQPHRDRTAAAPAPCAPSRAGPAMPTISPRLELDVRGLHLPLATQACRLQQRRSRSMPQRGRRSLAALDSGDLPTHHRRDQARRDSARSRDIRRRTRPLRSTVMRSANLIHLIEEMRDEQNRHALLRAADRSTAKSCRTSSVIEARRRLIENQHARRHVRRARDRHHLLNRPPDSSRAGASHRCPAARCEARARASRIARHSSRCRRRATTACRG